MVSRRHMQIHIIVILVRRLLVISLQIGMDQGTSNLYLDCLFSLLTCKFYRAHWLKVYGLGPTFAPNTVNWPRVFSLSAISSRQQQSAESLANDSTGLCQFIHDSQLGMDALGLANVGPACTNGLMDCLVTSSIHLDTCGFGTLQ